ncbi:MAG: hypothetical protein ACK4NY_03120 [Spirosomataceae bacterium]
MYIDFEKMPQDARLWVYQANRDLTEAEVDVVQANLQNTTQQWAAHGVPLLASFKILYNRFVVVAVDEGQNAASGCSIDASTRWLKELGNHLNIDFFDRSQAYLDGENIKTFSIFQAKQQVSNGIISPDAVVFVNDIKTIGDLFTRWKSKAVNTYLRKYFSGQAV